MLKRPIAASGLAALAIALVAAGSRAAVATVAAPATTARAAARVAAPAALPAGFVETTLAAGLDRPTALAVAPDGRVFVAEQGGTVRLVAGGALAPAPVLALSTVATGDLGLVGIAVAPDFAATPALFLAVTVEQPVRHVRIVRYKLDGDVAMPETAQTIADLDALSGSARIGGALHFGADGMLYAATGDDGNGAHAPSLSSTHGKILRLRPDGQIPEDNPFVGAATGVHGAIWAIGLRQPATFAIQPGSGRMFINDVGEAAFEEVNDGAAGDDYGWPTSEGPTTGGGVTGPVHSYPHSRGCAIAGGAFYNPDPALAMFPVELTGRYFFADHCQGEIRSIDPANPAADTVFGTPSVAGPVDLAVTADGALLVLARGQVGGGGAASGRLLRIDHVGAGAPKIRIPPSDVTAVIGHTARFSVRALGTPPLRYRWQRDGVDVPGGTQSVLDVGPVQRGDDGARFSVAVSNADGAIDSPAVRLTVVDRPPPTVVIDHPADGGRFRGDAPLTFAGHAVDGDGAALPASALRWRADLHAGGGVVPIMTELRDLAVGSVTLDLDAHRDAESFVRLYLTARDGQGLEATVHRDVHPERINLMLRSEPPGVAITVDARPITAPLAVPSIVGVRRTVQAPALARVDGALYAFERWSDGGAADHTLAPLTATLELTATYRFFGGSVPIVDWGGDYVDADTGLRGADGPVDRGIDLDRDGAYDDARWTIPLSDRLPLSPVVDRPGPSARFYGGLVIERHNGPLDERWARVWAGGPNRPNDQLAVGAGLGTRGWDLRYWRKDDFLGGGHDRRVAFDAGSRIELIGYGGGDGVPAHNSGRVRAVVKDGVQWYVSERTGEPAAGGASFVLSGLRDMGWAIYEPEPPGRLRFKAEIARFEPHAFLDVQAVGFLHSNDHVAPPAADARAGFAVERVRVLASLGAPATARPPAGPTDVPGTPSPATPTPTASRTATPGPSPTPTRTLRPGETPPPTDTPAPTATAAASDTPPPGATTARPTAGPTPTRHPTDIGGEGGTIHLPFALRGAPGRIAGRAAAGGRQAPRARRAAHDAGAAPPGLLRDDPGAGDSAVAADAIRAALPGGRLPVLVVLRPAVDTVRRDIGDDATAAAVAKAQAAVLSALDPADVTLLHRYSHVPVLYLAATARGCAALAGLPGVVAVEPDRLSRPLLAEHAAVVGADRAWADYGITGAGVNVAVIDTGVQADHPDLRDAIVAQKCFSVESGCGPNSAASESDDAIDRHGHGTGVAGIVAGRGRVAPRGIAPGAGIVAVRVFNADAQSAASDQIKAFDYLVRERRTLNVKIANMSLGSAKTYSGNCDNDDQARAAAIQTAITRGIAVFVATGNVGALNGLSMPGCLSNVIAVAATYDAELGREPDRGGYPSADGCFDEVASPTTVACFSNLGRGISVVAPGIWTTTSALGGRTATTGGTSNAAPVAAAVGALVLSVDDGLRPAELKRLLENTGTPVEARNGQKYPRVDAVAALAAAGATPAAAPTATPTPSRTPVPPTAPATATVAATATTAPAATDTPPDPSPTAAATDAPATATPTGPPATATPTDPPAVRPTIYLPVAANRAS